MRKLYIGNKNYSSWSLRGWLMAKIAGIEFDEIVVPLHRIGCKIGEPHGVLRGRVGDGQDTIGVAGVRAKPVLAVVGIARLIVGPAIRIGRPRTIGDAKRDRASLRPGHAEVEPLVEIRMRIRADVEIGGVTLKRGDDDVAAVKGGRNAERHGTVIVRPDSPGKS